MINNSGRDSDLSLLIVVCNQIWAQIWTQLSNAMFRSKLATHDLVWSLKVCMPHILSLTQKENLAVTWLNLDSGGYQNLPSSTKNASSSPFTSESPSPPAICFWISLADGRGFRSCQLSWMSITLERGTHLILSAEKRVLPHQNKKPFFGLPPIPTLVAFVLGSFGIPFLSLLSDSKDLRVICWSFLLNIKHITY